MAYGGMLKQSTAVDVLIGPFVDDSDGVTAETGLTIAQADVLLSKNGQSLTQKNDATAATHDSNGYYNCELDTTDTNTLGTLTLVVNESGALPIRLDFQIVTANVWDTFCSTDQLDVNVTNIEGSDATDQIRDAVVDDTTRIDASALNTLSGHDPGETIAGASDISGLNDLSAADVNAEVDTALADIHLDHLLAADYDPASKPGVATALLNELVESDGGVSRFTENALEQAPSGTGASAADIADAVWDEAQADHVAAGSFGLIASEIATIDGIVDNILADTNELQSDDIPGTLATMDGKLDTIDGIVDDILVDTGTTLQGELDGIQADTEDIQAQIGAAGAGLSAVPWNSAWDAEVQSECTDALNAYDPPTEAQMNARTLPAADYFDFSSDQVTVASNNDKTGYRLSATGVDDVLDEVVESTYTLREIVRIIMAVLAGETSGGGTGTLRFRDIADTKDRVVATVDANQNRTGVTLDEV